MATTEADGGQERASSTPGTRTVSRDRHDLAVLDGLRENA